MTVSAVRPWRTALQRERCLPSSVTGPVLLRALRRLASICLKVVIERQPQKLASFCDFGGHWVAVQRMSGPTPLLAAPSTNRGSGVRQPSEPGAFAPTGPWQRGRGRRRTYSTMRLHRRRGGPRDGEYGR